MRTAWIGLVLQMSTAAAQPYIDVASVSALASGRIHDADLDRSQGRLAKGDAQLLIPIGLRHGRDRLLLGIYHERWSIEPLQGIDPVWGPVISDPLWGYSIPITYLRELEPDRWKLAFTAIGRWMEATVNAPEPNDNTEVTIGDPQFGGAVLASRILGPELTWRFGLYVNNDAFGVFARPLLGIDWRINDRNNLFGILPNVLTYEHKAGRYIHCGLYYRAITSSYGEHGGDFRRLDENTVGAFLDFNILPSEFVLRIEAGHSVLSKYRGGEESIYYDEYGEGRYVDYGLGNGPYLKVMLAFRVRLDGEKATPEPSPGR